MVQQHSPTIVWFRQDLRLADNPALAAAADRGAPIVALYILDDATPGVWKMGGASRWWLHHSLTALGEGLRALGIPLVLRRGDAAEMLPALAAELGAGAVFWNRCYEPFAVARDTTIKSALIAAGIRTESFGAALLAEPWTVKGRSGDPLKVFTPFWRALSEGLDPPAPLATPTIRQTGPKAASEALADWRLTPEKPNWAAAFTEHWRPGEAGAQALLARFIDEALSGYADRRNLPGKTGVSRLSPHLHWGEISVRQIWRAIALHPGRGADSFLRELGWREFAHQLLWQFPALPEQPFIPRFADFPWRDDPAGLKAWQAGRTGYPLVDAGMRELWTTGWMHNRVRMVTASFLIKHLLIDWRLGEDWFWDCLVDADLAANATSWQWVAGSGADAAPYFRIFNPVLQGEKFDTDGAYVRRWVPEIAALPDQWLHRPWLAPAEVLSGAGVVLGRTYPAPIVDHAMARDRALAALATIRI